MFIDEASIQVKAGDGGSGSRSFRREKYVNKGGPDGGDGGRGGDVVLIAGRHVHTLLDVRGLKRCVAQNGRPGEGGQRTGRTGKGVVLELPCGTVVRDEATGIVLKDLTADGDSVVVAKGGRGGRGNRRFATSTDQAPTTCEPGKPGEQRDLTLTLKLIADVGLVGLPNAGKSSLLARLSAATPKIANYPFTTLSPVLGIVAPSEWARFVMADIPGLIEGAHAGAGLGDQFLKHISRAGILLHLVDVAPLSGPTPGEAYRAIRRELEQHSPALAAKPEILAANKVDLDPDETDLKAFQRSISRPIFPISTVTGVGLPALLSAIVELLGNQASERP